MIDMTKLEAGLRQMRGLDLMDVEDIMRGNRKYATTPSVKLTTEFYARLAARALDVPYNDIIELPLKEFSEVVDTVTIFLFNSSDSVTLAEN